MGNYHRSGWECSNKIHVIGWQCQMDNFSFSPPTTLTLQANKIRIDFHAKNLINFLILDSICRVSQFHLQYPSSTSSFSHLCTSAGWSPWFSEYANVSRVALLDYTAAIPSRSRVLSSDQPTQQSPRLLDIVLEIKLYSCVGGWVDGWIKGV